MNPSHFKPFPTQEIASRHSTKPLTTPTNTLQWVTHSKNPPSTRHLKPLPLSTPSPPRDPILLISRILPPILSPNQLSSKWTTSLGKCLNPKSMKRAFQPFRKLSRWEKSLLKICLSADSVVNVLRLVKITRNTWTNIFSWLSTKSMKPSWRENSKSNTRWNCSTLK